MCVHFLYRLGYTPCPYGEAITVTLSQGEFHHSEASKATKLCVHIVSTRYQPDMLIIRNRKASITYGCVRNPAETSVSHRAPWSVQMLCRTLLDLHSEGNDRHGSTSFPRLTPPRGWSITGELIVHSQTRSRGEKTEPCNRRVN